MNFLKRLTNRIAELSRQFYFSLANGNKLYLGKNIRFHKNTSLIIENSCKLEIGSNFFARSNFTVRVTNESSKNGGGYMRIGKNCFFNDFCSLTAMESITIGNDCIFGENVHIYDHNHNYKDSSKKIREQGFSTSPVRIGNNVWIGTNAVVLKGVTVGDNSIIGAGCVVYKDVPADSVLLSNGNVLNK